MKQFLYTDNLRGRGLSYLKKSEDFTDSFLTRVESYCGYRLSDSGENMEGQRYNLSFAGGRPLLMNYSYLGKEVTSQRHGNFLTHGFVSKIPLKGYAVDYFSNRDFFLRALSKGEAQSFTESEILPDKSDSGRAINTNGYDEIAQLFNQDVAFSCDLIQAVLLALKNDGHVRLFNFDSTKEYGNALNIVRAIQYLFPIELANRITFNTRAISYTPLQSVDLAALKSDRNLAPCTFGSVEVLQFYDQKRSSCGTEGCSYYFYYNSPYQSIHFNYPLPVISWLFEDGKITLQKILCFHNVVYKYFESGADPVESLLRQDWMSTMPVTTETRLSNPAKRIKTPKIKDVDESAHANADGGVVKAKNRKALCVAVFLLIALIALALVLVFVFIKNNTTEPGEIIDDPNKPAPPSIVPPDPNAYFTVKFENGTERRFRFTDEVQLEVPLAITGYTFNGYVDSAGKLFADAEGKLLDTYNIEDYAQITVSTSWSPNSNRIVISYGDGKSGELSCLTDGEITIPQKLVESIMASYAHMSVKGFALGSEIGNIICALRDDELVWEDGYHILSVDKYQSQLEKGEGIKLFPVAEYLKYTVDFYDYYDANSDKIGSMEIAYDKEITIPSSYYDKYMQNTYYVYVKQGNNFVKVFNTIENPEKWTGNYGLVKNYDDLIDTGENISLYISGLARVRIGSKQYDIEYGDDIFAKSEQLIEEDTSAKIKNVTTIYIGQSDENNYVKTNSAFWSNVNATAAIIVTPAYSATFRFAYSEGNLLTQGGIALERNVIYLHFSDGLYNCEGDTMADIKAVLKHNCPDITYGNGNISYADLVEDTWALGNDERYLKFESYLLKSSSAIESLFTENGEFCGDESVFEQEKDGAITVYAVYEPKTVDIRFSETLDTYSYKTSYGGTIDWEDISSKVKAVEQWGTYVSDWKCGRNILLSDQKTKDNVTSALLSGFGATTEEGGLVIRFNAERFKYSVNVNLKYGSYSKSATVNCDTVFNWEKEKIEKAYNIAIYSDATAWNVGWTVNGKAVTISDETKQTVADMFSSLIDIDDKNKEITVTKAIPSEYRNYRISYSQTMEYRVFSATNTIGGKQLNEVFNVQLGQVIKYNNNLDLGVPDEFTLENKFGFGTEYTYTFIGWYCEETQITGSDGVVRDFEELYALSADKKNLTVTAVFERNNDK